MCVCVCVFVSRHINTPHPIHPPVDIATEALLIPGDSLKVQGVLCSIKHGVGAVVARVVPKSWLSWCPDMG